LVKKASLPICLLFILGACVTVAPPPPNLYIEGLPQSMTADLTLEERIRAEEAWGYLREGWIYKAERSFLRLGENSPLYYVGFGYIALIEGSYETAEQQFNLALQNRPNFLLARLGLAQLYQKTEDDDRAFDELAKILEIDPQNSWARNAFDELKASQTEKAAASAAEALASGDTEKAKSEYLRALHFSPDAAEIHLALAGIYQQEKKPSSAIVHLKAAAEGEPGNTKILAAYAATLAETGEYERSLDIYEKILEIDRGNKEVLQQVESLKNKLGIYDLPSRYNEIPLAEAITREDLSALLAVKLGNALGEPGTQPPIIVDISASWASKFILKVTSFGLLDVYSNHTFQPRRALTRAELAETLTRVIRRLEQKGHRFMPQVSPQRIQISDVTPEHYYYQPIIQILSYQIMELSADRTFGPERPVSGLEAIRTIDILLALTR
jgi:tetratricopeptide (TPR) repeat protein